MATSSTMDTSKNGSVYSDAQVKRYLGRIGLPECYRSAANPKPNLELLDAIQKHHLSSIPFENLDIHYSSTHSISLDPQVIYDTFINRGHGGYCMQQNCLLMHMLLALGFTLYATGARVQRRVDGIPSGDWHGWSHMIIIVNLEKGAQWLVDVGFGGDGAKKPLPLISGHITQNIGPQEMRVTNERIDLHRDQAQRLWIYQTRNGIDRSWQSYYCFSEVEFLPQDFEMMNLWTSTNVGSIMTSTILTVRMQMRDGDIHGKFMLSGADLKVNNGGKTHLVKTCKTEGERIAVLGEYFGIHLNDSERAAIKGLITELPSS